MRRFLNLWPEIMDAIRGKEQDYTKINIRKALLLLSVPMVLEMIMESVFAVVDIFFVSQLGADAVAVVGITESTMTIVYAFGFGLAMATTALISRRIGEKRNKEAADIAWQSILSGVAISIPIAIVGLFYAEQILQLMGATVEMSSEHGKYMQWMLGGNMVIMLLFIINAVFRSAGDAAVAMRVLWTANILNIILDPILIFGWWIFPELGVAGAAIATNIGRGVAVIMQLFILFRGNKIIRLRLENLAIRLEILKQLVVKSLGGVA
ncbi:MAG: MATE family efflux transporter, partial [Bacteroidales bacterium]|nr:MATE family efflux transporter [Bacteroidales bacterium]